MSMKSHANVNHDVVVVAFRTIDTGRPLSQSNASPLVAALIGSAWKLFVSAEV